LLFNKNKHDKFHALELHDICGLDYVFEITYNKNVKLYVNAVCLRIFIKEYLLDIVSFITKCQKKRKCYPKFLIFNKKCHITPKSVTTPEILRFEKAYLILKLTIQDIHPY